MDEKTPTGFNIGLDTSEPEAGPSEPRKTSGKKKKPPRDTKKPRDTAMFIVFLGFLIILVAIGWLYYDIHERLQTINQSGSEEVARLSQEVSARLQTLDNQITAVKKASEKRLSRFDKNLEETNARLEKLQTGITSLENGLGGLQEGLDPLKKQLQQSEEKMADMRGTAQYIQTQQSEIQSQIETNSQKIQKLAGKLNSLSENRVTPDMLDKALEKERAFYEENTAHATETLFSEIAALKKQIQTLKANMEGLRERLVKLQEMPEPREGEIVEQEIQ